MFNKKKAQGIQRNRKIQPVQRENQDTIPEKDLKADLLDKDFKTTNLKILKELKEYLKKVKKTMYEQNGNINEDIKKHKKGPIKKLWI